MDNEKNKSKRIVIIIALLCLGLIFYKATWDNVNFLFFLAGGLDSPSATFNIVVNRIYKLAEKRDIDKIVVSYLHEGKNQYLNDIYIRTLGPIGDSQTAYELVDNFILNNRDKNYSTYFNVITSLGLIGNDEVVPILARALEDKEAFGIPTSKYLIARSLYLCTGERYEYVDEGGEIARLIVTDELQELRRLIENSKGRKRTFDEMMDFESLFRPPNDFNK